MAATNYTPIQLYYSASSGTTPAPGNLAAGELAINTADGKLFYKDSVGSVQVLATKGNIVSSTTTQVVYNSAGSLVGSANLTFSGTVLTSSFAGPVAATTLSASSTVSGTGFSTYLASPPAIGGTAAAAGSFTTLAASSTINGTTITASTQFSGPHNGTVGATTPSTGAFTTITASSTLALNGSSSTLGYATGSGGAVTQLTNRTTSVTINKASGAITLNLANGTASYTTFTVNNSLVEATDNIVVTARSGTNTYLPRVTAVAAGSFNITFNTTGGTAADSPIFNFALIKSVSA